MKRRIGLTVGRTYYVVSFSNPGVLIVYLSVLFSEPFEFRGCFVIPNTLLSAEFISSSKYLDCWLPCHSVCFRRHSLYIFYFICHCSLLSRVINIIVNVCTKQGNSSIKSVVYKVEIFLEQREVVFLSPNKIFANFAG